MQAAASSPSLQSVQDKIVAKHYDDALSDLDSLSETLRGDPEVLYMRAVCQRLSSRFDDALQTLSQIKAIAPEHGRAHQEEGHALRDMGRDADALVAYRRATRFNPALVASWKQQLRILVASGREAEVRQVRSQLDYLERLARPLIGARSG